jgi:hypothetical protein
MRLNNQTATAFATAYNQATSSRERADIRSEMRSIDSGRWYDVVSAAHTHLAHTDQESRRHVATMYGHQFLVWIGVYGLVEDLNTFDAVTGVERFE